MNLDQFERYTLTFGPTPIEPLKRLSINLGGKVDIWVKREDCNSGLAFGGNKIRKMEYLVPDIIKKNCDTLVSIGGIQSNHTRQVAAVAAKIGLKCYLIHGDWVNWNDSIYDRVGNIQISRILGAKITFSDEDFGIEIKKSWEEAIENIKKSGGVPYPIPAGASDHPLGGLGYTRFAYELRNQEKELGFEFDYIIVASASASTQAGMVVGFKPYSRSSRVIGIDVTAKPEETRTMVKVIAERTAEMIGLKQGIIDEDITFEKEYAYPAYGIPSTETIEAITQCASLEGMITDPVYEGKSMQGLIDMVKNDQFEKGAKILYVHLGGVPALSAYSYPFKNV